MEVNFEQYQYLRKNSINILLSKRLPRFSAALRVTLILMRVVLCSLPVLVEGYGTETEVYLASFALALIFFCKVGYMVSKQGANYFMHSTTCIDVIALFGILFTSATTLVFNFDEPQRGLIIDFYYTWSICCMLGILEIIHGLKRQSMLKKLYSLM